ncbi:MAG: hypothetical protein JWR22_3452 [Herminiimonas sp.]|nr:hypothetical protein [Herminiimonas sp.]
MHYTEYSVNSLHRIFDYIHAVGVLKKAPGSATVCPDKVSILCSKASQ